MTKRRRFRAWPSAPSSQPALESLTYAVALICVEAGLFAPGHVLAGEILDAVLVLILLNVSRDPAPGRSGERAATDAAMRALALVALVRVVAAGLPLGDGSQALGTLVIALLIVPTAIGIGYVASVPIFRLMALGPVRAPVLASAAGLVLGLAAYLFGAPRIWSTGAHGGGIALALAAATAAAAAEELMFRGVVQATFQRVVGRLGVVVATALFATTYLSAGSAGLVLVIALAGAVFGYVVWRTSSLGVAIAGHVVLALSAGALWPELLSADRGAWSHSPAATILAAVALAGAAASVMRWSDPTSAAPAPPPEPARTPPVRTPPQVVAILAVARRLGLA
ncbi:MAG: CPBP family intramembrane metalloprotease, partial [Actinomycetota bacterium]|nr:CPBP family intramembrane metalloprotease [Actinomycetota bacterium]